MINSGMIVIDLREAESEIWELSAVNVGSEEQIRE